MNLQYLLPHQLNQALDNGWPLLLAARPELVELERLGIGAPWYCTTSDSKAHKASIEAGERMWAAVVEAWVQKLAEMQRSKRLSPQDVTIQGLF